MALKTIISGVFTLFWVVIGWGQGSTNYENKPQGNHILRVDAVQLLVNEVRLSYEFPLNSTQSVVAGAGFIYPNRLLGEYELFSDFLLSTGGSVRAGYRYYPKITGHTRVFPWRSYLNAETFFSISGYKEEWFFIDFAGEGRVNEYHQISTDFNQLGFRAIMGFQRRIGRFVPDLYFGIGIKRVATASTTNIITEGDQAVILSTSTYPGTTSNFVDIVATPLLGIKIGIRTK